MPRNLFLYTIVAALGGFLFGFDTAVINGALPFFRDHFQLDKVMEGWAMSSAIFGCIVGAIGIGRPGDRYGRRYMLKIMAFLFLVSAIGTGLANNIAGFIFFRIIGGLAIGGASVLSPIYITEIAPAKYRGRFTLLFQLSLVIGILAAFATDLALINTGINNWRWMFISEAIPALLFFVLLFFVGRSPRWLVKKGFYNEALQVITQTNPGSNHKIILEEIKQSINTEVVDHMKYLFKKPYLRLVIIGLLVGMFNQFTGIAVVMIYSSDIFRAAGFGTESAILANCDSRCYQSGIYYPCYGIHRQDRPQIYASTGICWNDCFSGYFFIHFSGWNWRIYAAGIYDKFCCLFCLFAGSRCLGAFF
jgi:sugar porter (SP) family MFS transporter